MKNKKYFDSLKEQLIQKYSRDELAKILVKRKHQRISNLICAAYNLNIIRGLK